MMQRREFITLLGGAAATSSSMLSRVAYAQQGDRMRRVGVLLNLAPEDPEGQARLAAFLQGMQEAGWAVGRNLRVDLRWGGGNMDRVRQQALDLGALSPDVILASTNQAMVAMQQASRTIPIVFAAVTDPVAGGFVMSLPRPGRNATGFTSAEYSMSAKWLELLKDVVPSTTRAAVLYDARNPGGLPQFAAVQSMASTLGIELTPVTLLNISEIEQAIATFSQMPNGGLVVTRIAEAIVHREAIIAAAASHRLPAVYPLRFFASDGGLLAYGPDIIDQHRRAAGYIDRILKGEKPTDLPVQAPTKYELVINLKTAKALGLEVPPTLLARADEVIE
jgi:putative ABC transport system substrate-binding protein